MSGRVCYHGDLWISSELRGKKLGPVFASLGIALARINLDPDYYYGFMEDPVVWSGFNQREGFMHAAPLGDGWRLAEGFLLPSDYIVWMSRSEVHRLIYRDRRQTVSRIRALPQGQISLGTEGGSN